MMKINGLLGYLKDSNAPAHSVDSDIFYAAIHLQLQQTLTGRLLTIFSTNMAV